MLHSNMLLKCCYSYYVVNTKTILLKSLSVFDRKNMDKKFKRHTLRMKLWVGQTELHRSELVSKGMGSWSCINLEEHESWEVTKVDEL